jgi:multiple sugar transport system permease protein
MLQTFSLNVLKTTAKFGRRLISLRIAISISLLSLLSSRSIALSQDVIHLQVLNWASAEELKSEMEIVKGFEQENPGIQVEFETVPPGQKEKVLTRIAAGNPPDVFLLDSVHLPAFFRNRVLVDLMPFVKEFGIDLDIYFPNVLQIAMLDSQLFAIPKDFNSLMMFYNKDLFDQSGIPYLEPGWTWDEFVEISRQLTLDLDEDGQIDQYGTALELRFLFWQPWLWISGGDILNPDGSSASGYFNSKASRQAVSFLADLNRKYHVTPAAQALKRQGMLTNLFFSGRVATMVTGHWAVTKFKKYIETGDLRIGAVHIPVPSGGIRQTVMYESGWCVPKGVRHLDLSVKLALFLGGEYAARIRSESGIAIPAIQSVAEEQRLADPWGIEEAFFNEIPYCRQPWGTRVEEFRRIELVAEDAMEAIMNRSADVPETLDQAAREIDRILEQSERARAPATTGGDRQIWVFLLTVIFLAGAGVLIYAFKLKGSDRKSYLEGLQFLAPSMLLLLAFVVTPLIFSLYLSTHQWDIISASKPFVGLDHYFKLVKDAQFWNSLKNTAIFTLQVPVGMMISLLVAMMVNQRLKGVNFFRTLFFLPSVTSFVAIALVWQWMYHPQFGLANFLLGKLGLGPYPWLTNPQMALISIMILTVWMGIGYQMVIFLAGLQGIPENLYEAARIDGASVWQRFRHVTFPQLMPTTFFVLVTSVIGSFQVFTPVFVMTEGGPARSTDVVMYHIYQSAWEYLRMGEASAMSWFLFLVILIATYLQFKLLGKRVTYG